MPILRVQGILIPPTSLSVLNPPHSTNVFRVYLSTFQKIYSRPKIHRKSVDKMADMRSQIGVSGTIYQTHLKLRCIFVCKWLAALGSAFNFGSWSKSIWTVFCLAAHETSLQAAPESVRVGHILWKYVTHSLLRPTHSTRFKTHVHTRERHLKQHQLLCSDGAPASK